MKNNDASSSRFRLAGPFDAVRNYRSLTWEMTRREILGRYRGASFGLLWSLISPFMMLTIYTIAFGYVLKSRWPGAGGNIADFAMLLFVGLIVHGFFAECLTRSSNLVVGNPNLVKRIVFPLHILPWSMILSALFHALANSVVFATINFIVRGELHSTILLLPVIFVPLSIGVLGVGWLLSALTVFLRDINQITGVLATAMLFLSSAIVPVETLPETYQAVFKLNPLTFIIDQAREVAFWGRLPNWEGLVLYTLGAVIFAYIGYAVFQKTRRGFADVL